MLNNIIRFSLQNRLLILVAAVLLLIGGTYTAFHTEVDVFPDLNAPTVVVMTEANGMAAEEVDIVQRSDGSFLVDGQCPFHDFLIFFGLLTKSDNFFFSTVLLFKRVIV